MIRTTRRQPHPAIPVCEVNFSSFFLNFRAKEMFVQCSVTFYAYISPHTYIYIHAMQQLRYPGKHYNYLPYPWGHSDNTKLNKVHGIISLAT